MDTNPTPRGDIASGSAAGSVAAVLLLLFGVINEGRVVNVSEAIAVLTPLVQLGAAYVSTTYKIGVMAIAGAVTVLLASGLAYFTGGQIDQVLLTGAVAAVVTWAVAAGLPAR